MIKILQMLILEYSIYFLEWKTVVILDILEKFPEFGKKYPNTNI